MPIYILLINSVKLDTEIKSAPISLPNSLHFENYIDAFFAGKFGPALFNSLKLAIIVAIFVIVLAGFAAYALARMRTSGKFKINTYFLFGMAVPAQLYLVPLYSNLLHLNLGDTHLGLIIVYIGIYLPFSIFFLRSFFLLLPVGIEESALLDGCNTIQLITRIILPISRPAILSLTVILFTWVWNEFMFAVTLIQSDSLKTASTQYLAFSGNHDIDLSLVSAAGIITTMPIILLFLFLQRSFIDGMTSGSIK
jgi:raffinose/stachyose/melibiose transport system permease protein